MYVLNRNMNYKYLLPINLLIVCLIFFGIGCLSEKNIGSVDVKPESSIEERYIESQKARLLRSHKENLTVQVNFYQWLSLKELEDLLSKKSTFKITRINTKFFTVTNGLKISINFSEEENLENISKKIDEFAMEYEYVGKPDIASSLRQAIVSENVHVGSIRLTGDLQEIKDWWKENSNAVRIIQIIENEFDEIQQTFEPGEVIR